MVVWNSKSRLLRSSDCVRPIGSATPSTSFQSERLICGGGCSESRNRKLAMHRGKVGHCQREHLMGNNLGCHYRTARKLRVRCLMKRVAVHKTLVNGRRL